jgi:anti-sigma regulatory factor (Ser/Thr protein kinase)/GNAT superfamily N-acetyltransferase
MKKQTDLGHLYLPNDEALIPAVTRYTSEVVKLSGFDKEQGKKIQMALEEAILYVLNNAFDASELGEYNIRFVKLLNGIEIHIHDMGLPYNPNTEPDYDPTADISNLNDAGLGTFLISKTMDEYRFNNLGIKGKELVLVKYLESACIVDEYEGPVEAEVVVPPTKAPVEQIHFDIRLMKPDEALEICRCIYDCYGYSYANENIYYPERVAAMNADGKLRSAVAMTPDNEMGGHFALIYYDKLPAEAGIAVTKKKFRGQGFARQMGEFLELEARKDGLKGMQVKEVTSHPYTQKFCLKLGYKDCGMLLAHSPKSLSFKGINENLEQRNSDVLGFKYLTTPEPRKIYALQKHAGMLEKLFNNLGAEVEFLQPQLSEAAQAQGAMSVTIHTLRSLAEIMIDQIGEDTLLTLQQEMRKIFREEIQVMELYLSLNDPQSPEIVSQLEKMGFIFTGILPETSMGDAIIMQFFNGIHIDYDKIILVTDMAKELLNYIRENDPRA